MTDKQLNRLAQAWVLHESDEYLQGIDRERALTNMVIEQRRWIGRVERENDELKRENAKLGRQRTEAWAVAAAFAFVAVVTNVILIAVVWP